MCINKHNSFGCNAINNNSLIRRISGLMQRDEGSSLVYLAIVLFGLIIVAGLAIDGSNAFRQNRTMQTAADAAALAGVRTLALEQSGAQVTNSAVTLATANGAANTNAAGITVAGNEVQADVAVEFDTYFARLIPGWSKMTIGSSAAATYEPITYPEEFLPIAFHKTCVATQTTTTFKPPVREYCADDVAQYFNANMNFTFYLPNLDLDKTMVPGQFLTYSLFEEVGSSGQFIEYDDGTAQVTVSIVNPDGDGFDMVLNLSGRTAQTPPGSPKFGVVMTSTDDWYYYTGQAGTLTGRPGRFEGAEISLVAYGASYQVGTGANFMEATPFGAAGWNEWTVIQQPTTGVILRSSGYGDSLHRLRDCSPTVDADVDVITTPMCEFVWLDTDGSTQSVSTLTSALQNPNNDGAWRAGDWVPSGPYSGGGVTANVGTTFSNWIGVPVTVGIYGADNITLTDDMEYRLDGFARMVLEGVNYSTGAVTLRFEPAVVSGIETNAAAPDFGLRDIHLVR